MKKRILIAIEPIMRGSRVHILMYFLSAVNPLYDKIYVVTREDYENRLLDELMKKYDIENVEYVRSVNIGNAWIKKLNCKEFKCVKSSVESIINNLRENEIADVIFMAIDDYFVPFLISSFTWSLKKISRCFFIRYRVYYATRSLKSKVKQALVFAGIFYLLFFKKMRMLNFDERIERKKNLLYNYTNKITTLPDPWDGEYDKVERTVARTRLNIKEDSFVIALIGRQNQRKGFPFILKNIHEILKVNNVVILISGKIENEYEEKLLLDIIKNYKKRIIYIPDYLSEQDIVYSYAAADVILLPYSFDFSFSSGVLARACAAGVPVIASSHGLVGERVKRYKIGLVFEYEDVKKLLECINKLINNKKLLEELQHNCSIYKQITSLTQFKSKVKNIFIDDKE